MILERLHSYVLYGRRNQPCIGYILLLLRTWFFFFFFFWFAGWYSVRSNQFTRLPPPYLRRCLAPCRAACATRVRLPEHHITSSLFNVLCLRWMTDPGSEIRIGSNLRPDTALPSILPFADATRRATLRCCAARRTRWRADYPHDTHFCLTCTIRRCCRDLRAVARQYYGIQFSSVHAIVVHSLMPCCSSRRYHH